MQPCNSITFQPRRDTSINWTSVNPVLRTGELAYDYDTGYFRIGDGYSRWTELIPFRMPTEWCGYLPDGQPVFRFHIPDKE